VSRWLPAVERSVALVFEVARRGQLPARFALMANVPSIRELIDEAEQPSRWWAYVLAGALGLGGFVFLERSSEAARPDDPALEVLSPQVIAAEAAEGHRLFIQLCATCHGQHAEGSIGPNLTDVYWLHGGGPSALASSVSRGHPEQGMPPWAKPLGRSRVKRIVFYLRSLREASLPPGVKGKAPEGTMGS